MIKNKETNFICELKSLKDLSIFMKKFEEYADLHCIKKNIFFDIKLCIEETLINIFSHGYLSDDGQKTSTEKPSVEPKVCVSICKKKNFLVADVTDNAKKFNPLSAFFAADIYSDLESRKVGGLGTHLLKKLSDELEYIKVNHGNHLRIHKKLK